MKLTLNPQCYIPALQPAVGGHSGTTRHIGTAHSTRLFNQQLCVCALENDSNSRMTHQSLSMSEPVVDESQTKGSAATEYEELE
jgi:hypothetical protein